MPWSIELLPAGYDEVTRAFTVPALESDEDWTLEARTRASVADGMEE